MKVASTTIIFLIVLLECESLTFLKKNDQNKTLQVSTKTGIVQGRERRTTKQTQFFSYEGIPFAQPPINNLRFRSPQPVKPWRGVLNATDLSEGCIEIRIRFIEIYTPGSEDCLYLNVYTPKNRKISKDGLLPVIVWIYGGGFIEGLAALYGPYNLLDKNLVVVTFNYRLGAFGFLSTEDEASPGNYGLKDQNAALRWINANIKQFGGDPTKVTISGHSAGASSVLHHMIAPKSRGLFSRAIAWSGDTTSVWGEQKQAKSTALDLAASLGINTDNTTEVIERLRMVDAKQLTSAQMMTVLVYSTTIFSSGVSFCPSVEPDIPEAFYTEPSYETLKKGDIAKVPLMIGTASMEAGLFAKLFYLIKPLLVYLDISPSSVPNGKIKKSSFQENRRIGKRLLEKYFASKSISGSANHELITFFTHLIFLIPITRTARLLSPHIPVYFFVNDHQEKYAKLFLEASKFPIDPKTNGVTHGEDVPLIWIYSHLGTPPQSVFIQKKFLQLWKNFATTGNPTPTFDPAIGTIWPPITDNNNISYLAIKNDVKVEYNYKKDIIDFWDETLNEFIK